MVWEAIRAEEGEEEKVINVGVMSVGQRKTITGMTHVHMVEFERRKGGSSSTVGSVFSSM